MIMHPFITAALADDRRKTLLAQAEAARLARQARSQRPQNIVSTARTSSKRLCALAVQGWRSYGPVAARD